MARRESTAVERALALVRRGWAPSKAAARWGISRSTIYRAMRRHGIPIGGLTK